MQARQPVLNSNPGDPARIGKLPPIAVEEEEWLCACLLMIPDAISMVADKLKPENFYSGRFKAVYTAILSLYNQQKDCGLTAVARWLTDNKLIEQAGGMKGLSALMDHFEMPHHVIPYTEIILEKYQRRQAIEAAYKAIELAHDAIDWAAGKEEIEQTFFKLTDSSSGQNLRSFAELRDFTADDLLRRSDGVQSGIASGFYDLDAMTQGFQRKDLIIVAGRPSMGKTAFVTNCAQFVCEKLRLPVLMFSLEMSAEQIFSRMLASEARISSASLRTGKISNWDPVSLALVKLGEITAYIDDSPTITPAAIRSRARQVKARHQDLGLILIDYLQLMGGDDDRNRVQELSRITRSLKRLARELNVPVIALSQLSRDVESRNNKRPMMSDLRESGAIEQDADLIMMLYRDEYYNPDTPDRGIAEVIITKHRNGPTGTVKLLFETHYTKFMNLRGSNHA